MTTQRFPIWPPSTPFPESQQDTIGDGAPDFPTSPGSREQGKFRPSDTPKLVQVAVVNDDGTIIGHALIPSTEEQTLWLRALVRGIELLLGEYNIGVDLVKEVANESAGVA